MSYSKFGDIRKSEATASEGQLDTDRTNTDTRYIIAFGIFIIIWISSAGHAFHAGDAITVDFINALHHGEILELTEFLVKYFQEAKNIIVSFVLLSILLLGILITLFRWAAKSLIYITIVLMTVLLVLTYGLIFYGIHSERIRLDILAFLTIIVIMYGLVIYTFKQTGIKAVSKIIRQSCKAMFFFPSTFLFMTLQYLLQLAIISYAGAVYVFLNSIRLPANESFEDFLDGNESSSAVSNETLDALYEDYDLVEEFHKRTLVPLYVYPLHAINVLGLIWALGFVAGLGRMALTATFATWYQCADRTLIPKWTLPRNFFAILTRHSGTIAYASSPASLVPMAVIVYKHERDRLKEMLRKPFLILSWLIILSRFSSNGLAECAIHGKTFYKSAKDSYVLLMKNPMSFLTTNTISECMIFLASSLVPFLTLLATLAYCYWRKDLHHPVIVASVLTVTIASVALSVTFFAVFRAASSTIHRCHLEDSKFSHEAEMKLYEIQVDDDTINDLEA